MSEIKEEIQIGDYIITDIKQKDINTVTIWARKIDFSTLTDENIEELEGILAQMDFWESFISLVNEIKSALKKEKIYDISLDILYRPNKYEFTSWLISSRFQPNSSIGTHINYNKMESMHITKGVCMTAPLKLEEIQIKIKNLERWVAFKVIMETFCTHILPTFKI